MRDEDDPASGQGGQKGKNGKRPPLPRRLVTRQDAAGYLGISEWSVKSLHWQGHLPVVKLPGCRRALYDLADLAELIEAHKAR